MRKMLKKKSLIASGIAVMLVVAMLCSSAIAFLSDSSDEVENTFLTNQNGVDLEETTGDDYDIVPGTEEEKDPTITATYTLDSYVFVVVTDNTQELVTYEIAEGWIKLDVETEDGVSVYYQVVTYDADDADEDGLCTSILSVLKDNQVSYDIDLTNEDLADKDDVTLTFQAFIVQCEGFDTAEAAWYALGVTAE